MCASSLLPDPRVAAASTLPSSLYTDASVLPQENTGVFSRTWQLVGQADQVAVPGQYFTAAVADEPLLIVRGEDRLRALSNVCRHRAGPVMQGAGSCRAFRCGYHGWSYALDGRLVNTPEFEGVENFAKEDHGLPEFRVETWLGLVFVNLDAAAPSLVATLEDLPDSLAARDLDSLRLAHRKEWTLACNWKVYVDNYLEGYHIPIVHPGLMKEIDYSRYETETRRAYSIQHSPIKGTPERKLRAGSGEQARFFWIYPNLMLNVYPDNFSTNLILPLGHDRTLTVFEWFFRDPESPHTRELVRQTVEFSDEIQREDVAICEAVQRGLKSRTYDRGRYSVRRENGVHHFHRLYAEAMNGSAQGADPGGGGGASGR